MASIERRIEALEGLIPPPAPPKEEAGESAAREGEGRAIIKVVYDDPPESESVADASALARRPMVNDHEADPTPGDLAEAEAVPGEATEEAADPLPEPKPPTL